MASNQKLHWSTDPFLNCYNSIKYDGKVNRDLLRELKNDLLSLTTVPPADSTKLGEEVEFDGDKFKLNSLFLESSTVLSLELNLNVAATAEVLYHAQQNVGYQIGTDFVDSGRVAFYTRFLYILNIVGYLATTSQLAELVETDAEFQKLFEKLLDSFTAVYSRLQVLNDLIDKQRTVGDLNSLQFVNAIKYSKSENFQLHELLGSLLYGFIQNFPDRFANAGNYSKIIAHISKNLKDDDVFVLHYLPGLLELLQQANKTDAVVEDLYKSITTKLLLDYSKIATTSNNGESEVDISKSTLSPTEIVLSLVSLTGFITWCKKDQARTSKYNFEKDILKYIEWTITYGAFEKLLCIAADTRASEVLSSTFAYDFRSLLQRNFPSFTTLKLTYPGATEILNIAFSNNQTNVISLLSNEEYLVDQLFKDQLIAPYIHNFFKQFISNSAIILTLLRDNEEDFLLSSTTRKEEEREKRRKEQETQDNDKKNDDPYNSTSTTINSNTGNPDSSDSFDDDSIDLDEIASRADLERFYLAFTYTHQNRSEICRMFWDQDEQGVNELLGFISWGLTNNTSPLISSTFSVLLGSLTFGGETAASKVWDVLINNNSTSVKKNDFSKISVDSISESLYYYVNSLNKNFREDLQMQNQQQKQILQDFLLPTNPGLRVGHRKPSNVGADKDSDHTTPIVIELAEDSVVFIAGFMHLLRCIVSNLSVTPSEKSKKIKNLIFIRFQPIICEFLKFDNLIIGTKASMSIKKQNDGDGSLLFVNDDNRVVLINLMLEFLGSFVDEDLVLRNQVWEIIDRWAFNGGWPIERPIEDSSFQSSNENTMKFSTTSYKSVRIVLYFQNSLTQLSQVSNFVNLIANLLQPPNDEQKAFRRYKLLYPADLGKDYRDIGIWPYIEYILVEVFAKSVLLSDANERREIQLPIINMIISSLKDIDWSFLNDVAPVAIKDSVLNLDFCIESPELSYQLFIKLHQSMAIMNYLFDERVYRALLNVIKGDDETQIEGSLNVVQLVLEMQDTFINRLLPILKVNDTETSENNSSNSVQGSGFARNAFNRFAGYGTNLSMALATPKTVFDNIYYPKTIGLQGISNFYEILLFNLPAVTKFGVFIGSHNIEITQSAITILKYISQSNFFVNSDATNLLNNNRLLTAFENINESETIKYAFIKELEKYAEQEADLEVKFKVLEFLYMNIDGFTASLSHFLLGYEIQGGSLQLNEKSKQNTLLKSLICLLNSSLDSISDIDYNNGNVNNINLAPAKVSSLILEILVKLCRDKISSRVTLNYLRDFELEGGVSLFTKLIECQPKVDLSSIWSSHVFDGDLQSKYNNNFIEDSKSVLTLFAFIRHRNMILQYLSLEFHFTSQQRSITRRESYIDLLLNGNEFLTGSPRVLSFLDILNFKFDNFSVSNYDKFDSKYDLPVILQHMKESTGENVLDLKIMEKIYKVICKLAANQLTTKELRISFGQEIMDEGSKIAEFLTKYVIYNDFKATQLSCLHLWVQLIQVLLTDGKMDQIKKSNFILEVFQIILPKINDYLEFDILFAEELISLSVLLFDIYEKENREAGLDRLFPLFQTCINGVLCLYLTPELRSDLYILANKFLQKSFANESLLKDLTLTIKSVDNKFVDILCNDALYAEGAPRITSLIFLESVIHLTSLNRVNFILERIIKNNSLSLLVRSLKRTDEILQTEGNSTGGYSLNNLLYELTAFKSTLYLLLRISTTRTGASQLIQCELFPIIKDSKFLSIDPDLGLNLKINASSDSTSDSFTVHLSLDTPLPLVDNHQEEASKSDISYFEFLVPVFQLIAGVLISMGPTYKPSIIQGKDLMKHFHKLVLGVVKRDSLIETKRNSKKFADAYAEDGISYLGLKELIKLITLLDTLVSETENN